MEKNRMTELEEIEAHGAETGWVAPLTDEDKEFFAYFARCATATIFHPRRQHGWSMIL